MWSYHFAVSRHPDRKTLLIDKYSRAFRETFSVIDWHCLLIPVPNNIRQAHYRAFMILRLTFQKVSLSIIKSQNIITFFWKLDLVLRMNVLKRSSTCHLIITSYTHIWPSQFSERIPSTINIDTNLLHSSCFPSLTIMTNYTCGSELLNMWSNLLHLMKPSHHNTLAKYRRQGSIVRFLCCNLIHFTSY